MECVYPSKARKWLGPKRHPTPASRDSSLITSPAGELPMTAFSGDDMRFFHHFLVAAHPHLPYGNEHSWTMRVPRYAHAYPCLMHAILSLGATHYALLAPNGSQYASTAIIHRGKALKALGTALGKGPEATNTEMDVILATCYTLVFQAYQMNDGLVDFAVMVRGCGIVTGWILERFQTSQMFTLQTESDVDALIAGELSDEPLSTPHSIEALLVAMHKLPPLLNSPAHHRFFHAIRNTLAAMQISMKRTFVNLTSIYAVWYQMENKEFLTFIAPANHVSRALFLFFLAVELIMQPVFLKLNGFKGHKPPVTMSLVHQWADTIYGELPASVREYVQVPTEMILADGGLRAVISQRAAFSDLHTLFSDVEGSTWLGCM
ncbi:uncharacterized protein ACLA_063470 [Aspergillus clavatus NRRL 1]|uniref:C6 transcription factor n=1 Tax=Aspergillus clavatus (strain ATCC 1007 / CBS 513.65 / DSM 816 / NCTC 3887 / NRRL 1 / QM 1276 / 107) TaxID=344612 RepID=A1CCX2_ASPCL|nr:uncharacterized protein ACLA_063470 [Aspergillus clavatus NRRL 1]EAW12379.1 hypothetical protein ACLA_063470 [Aspergillus clavatus NRRL 1]